MPESLYVVEYCCFLMPLLEVAGMLFLDADMAVDDLFVTPCLLYDEACCYWVYKTSKRLETSQAIIVLTLSGFKVV